MPSGRFTRIVAFTVLVILCVSAGVWLAPRVRTGPGAAGAAPQAGMDAYRAEPGTALLNVLPPPGASSDAIDAAWQRLITTHAARIARAEVVAEVLGDPGGAARKTRWFATRDSAQHAGAVQGLMRATSVRVVPGTSLIAVRVDVEPPADAAALTNDLCFAYIRMCADAHVRALQDRVKLLGRELAMVKIELDTEIKPALLSKERDLGADGVATFVVFNSRQVYLTRLVEERIRIETLLAEQESRLNALVKDLADGKVPPGVRSEVRQHPEYLRASERLAEAEAEVQAAKSADPADAKAVAARQKQRDARRAALDRVRKELTTEIGEIQRNQVRNRRDELFAQAQQIDRQMDQVGKGTAELNQKSHEYRGLQHRERDLRERFNSLNAQMTRINQFDINSPFTAVEWAQKAKAGW
jgi:hypothetical protein